jgi:hypothetical protein
MPIFRLQMLKIAKIDSHNIFRPLRAVFKTSVGANSRVGDNSAECHRCVGASSPRSRENLFKKLASVLFRFLVSNYLLYLLQRMLHV